MLFHPFSLVGCQGRTNFRPFFLAIPVRYNELGHTLKYRDPVPEQCRCTHQSPFTNLKLPGELGGKGCALLKMFWYGGECQEMHALPLKCCMRRQVQVWQRAQMKMQYWHLDNVLEVIYIMAEHHQAHAHEANPKSDQALKVPAGVCAWHDLRYCSIAK